ncbi:class I mannose-6-phosphate isomerase [Microbacterium kyungheense]|uniref:Mannose-6-phosphate isomerase class I n=1 Tax=Microbacterium kyungheense TaxID=1263636 RepID=A0A543FK20_9MICO|nr:class I mannose-6-phosphate isomerase [Microbacterium kyungheense]TQM34220.1 mannose-6-phosphate isomerase class I [Microbacterium kyungheense]
MTVDSRGVPLEDYMLDDRSSYVKLPTIPLPQGSRVIVGDDAWRAAMDIASAATGHPLIAVDVYPGADVAAIVARIGEVLPEAEVIDVEEAAAADPEAIEALIARNLTDDRVFGVMSHFTVDEFYDAARLSSLQERVDERSRATVLVGWGADLAARRRADALVLVDMARWEIQQRMRAGASNWRAHNGDLDVLRKYKRGFFVEWRTADRHKRTLLDRLDLLVDGNAAQDEAGAVRGEDLRAALAAATATPFRVVPFFDPGVWGGQWMKNTLDLDPAEHNYAWCFDCVPEENSLLLEADGRVVEIPAMDLVLSRPRELLGARTFARFGAEFPIRFDFLDTMGGGNLSLQVHPLTEYIRDTFGMAYTQDESYYMLDAADDAVVYLGVKTGVDPDQMIADLRAATDGEHPFDAEKYVNVFPAKKHDHFLIPAGTVHCSGENSMVLEISATPFIFTFKLWDWGRVGLDGVPRPVHIDHGEQNIQWERDTEWVERNLVGQVEELRREPGLVEERTGLHELEFIEVRRHWFEDEAAHDTEGTVNVLNLVEGDEVEIVSPTGAFAPYAIHYAETFIVPAAVGPYVVRRSPNSRSERFATVKAYVRGTRSTDS